MVEPGASSDGPPEGGTPAGAQPSRRRPGPRGWAIGIVLAAALIAALAIWQTGRSGPAVAAASPSPGTARFDPLVALVDSNGALATVDSTGMAAILASEPGTTFGFPAWSPDGSRVAAVKYAAKDTSIAVFTVRPGGVAPSPAPAPVVVYRSAAVPPFYLYWTPDGQRVSFLATETDGISLRVAPADGSASLDGSPATVIRRGAPLYFDWIGVDRLLLHVGSGPDAFLGEVGLDGASIAPAIDRSGDFRPAVADASGRFVAFVRGQPPSAELIVAARDGSAEHSTPVFGPAAIVFDPTGVTVASIAADEPSQAGFAFPFGPLRLIDASSGAIRTLLDGNVVGFYWAPDGRTIAAMRLQAGNGSTVADGAVVAAGALVAAATSTPSQTPRQTPTPTSTPTPDAELHLIFVNVADGAVRSDAVIRLTNLFVSQFLPYFDQYALSHHVWAPDSNSILLPVIDRTGRDRLVALPVDGSSTSRTFDGEFGFWSP
jgi:TolB protein